MPLATERVPPCNNTSRTKTEYNEIKPCEIMFEIHDSLQASEI